MSRLSLRPRVLAAALVAFAILCCLAPPPAGAQAVSGTILGFVKDSTGAVVPGATVTLVNTGTGYSRSVVTDASGEYTAPLIPTGTYTVTAELTGFKKASKTNVLLGVDQKVRMDLALELGAMTEVVEIQAETPLLQTASSELGATIVEEQIRTLPLNGRNFVSLTRTVPGILRGQPGGNIDGAGSLAWRASASFSANGQRTRDNNYMLDGVDNNETWLQTVVIFPSVDALQEFKLQTSTYSAEFGRSLGGVVNLQLKSGTNDYHGSVFAFNRNDSFDANNWFNNRAGRKKADLSQNQFGATFGGPIIKDKTFFFADYQGLRITSGQTYLSTVPSLAMRQGNFSELNRVIYDPLTGQPFPGNIIPESRWDPASKNIMQQLYPEPNTAGSVGATGQPINNYLITPNLERDDNQFDVKVDHRLTQNNRFFVRYSYQKTARFLPATLEHGDAGATFGAGDGEHQGAERDVQRHAHLQPDPDQRVPLRLELDQVPHDVDRLRAEPRPGDGHPRHQRQRGHLGDDPDAVPEHPEPGGERQPAADHEPERLPDLRQRHLDQGQAHAQGSAAASPSARARSSTPTRSSGSSASTTT